MMSPGHAKHKELPHDLRQALEALSPHDHLCLIYETPEEWKNAVIPFIRIGIERGEKCIYVVDAHTAEEVREELKREGVGVSRAEKEGRLAILHESEAYTREGSFDPDRMIELLIKETVKALKEGYPASRVTGEMTWVLKSHPGSEKVIEYESKLNRDLFQKHACLAICQYDRWKFDPEIIKGVVLTHPLLIRGNRVYRNFYYIPTEAFLNVKRAEMEVRHWFDNIERERHTFESLRESEENYRTLLEGIQDGVYTLDVEGRFTFVNDVILQRSGYPKEWFIGKSYLDVIRKEDRKRVQKNFEAVIRGETVMPYELAYFIAPGNIMWIETNTTALWKDNRIVGLLGVSRNTTDRRLAEDEQQKQHIRTEVLDKTSQILTNVTFDYEGALQTIAQQLSDLIGDACTLNLLSEDGQFIHTVAVHHPDPDTSAHIRTLMTSSSYYIGTGFMGGVARKDKPFLIADMPQEEIRAAMKPELRPYLDRPGLYSMLMVPMHALGRVIGTVGLTRDKPGRPYTLKDQSLLQELADRAALTIVNARLYDEKTKYQEHLEVLVESIKRREHQLRLLTDNVPGYIAYVEAYDLCYRFVNQKYEAFFSFNRDEIIGKSVKDVIGKSNYESALPYIEKVQSGKDASYENVFNTPQGKRWLSINYVPDFNERGEVVGIFILNYDITERKQAEEALRRAEEKYRSIFEYAVEGIYQSTPEGRFLTVNPSFAGILGYATPEEAITAITDIAKQLYVQPDHRTQFKDPLEQHGFVMGFETQFYRKDGSIVWISNNARAVRDREGHILYYEGTLVDVTQRKEAAEELAWALEKTRKAIGTTIQAMVSVVETKDLYTAGHQKRTTHLARMIAAEMNLSQEHIEAIRMAGAIHDIGKISVPTEILSKPTKLTSIELSLARSHAQNGYEILKDVESPWPVAEIVLQHHERIDGSGYPRGLKGNEILIEARIIAVADVVEAIASHRPYRPALGIEVALEEVEKNKGILYDREAAEVCLRLFREKGFKFE